MQNYADGRSSVSLSLITYQKGISLPPCNKGRGGSCPCGSGAPGYLLELWTCTKERGSLFFQTQCDAWFTQNATQRPYLLFMQMMQALSSFYFPVLHWMETKLKTT